MSGFDYINRTYGLNLKRGSRVEYTGGKVARLGTVTSAAGAHINIRFDGETASVGPFHPTWEMRVLPTQEPTNE